MKTSGEREMIRTVIQGYPPEKRLSRKVIADALYTNQL
jgi:hypothetical protein